MFATTDWNNVLAAANPVASDARERLAGRYWLPLYALARRKGLTPADAQDAVQGFLGRIFEGDRLAAVSVEGGRFRDFLRSGLENFLISQHRAETRQCRRPPGGFASPDSEDPEAWAALGAVDSRTPEQVYDRCCARRLLDRALANLRAEYKEQGRTELFAHLTACLDRDVHTTAHEEVARRLGLHPGTVRNAVKPFRERFRELFRREVAATLNDPSRVDEEIRDLLAAL
jgi:RNA polymerase sigma-70 factor (ECF subfamily)